MDLPQALLGLRAALPLATLLGRPLDMLYSRCMWQMVPSESCVLMWWMQLLGQRKQLCTVA